VIITGIAHFDDSIQAFQCLEILFKVGKPNPFLQSLIEEDGEVSIASIIPSSGVVDDYYYYSGSVDLPWPDCWEPVTWYIPNYVVEASAAQIDYWTERYVQDLSFSNGKGSARDVQPLNNRTVYHFIPSSYSV
jgi:carbonic anhydrase